MAQEVFDAIIPHNRAEAEEMIRLSIVTVLWTAFAVQVVSLLS